MIQSMTGFAAKTFVLELDAQHKTNITISVKTLNSRFFEAKCKRENECELTKLFLVRYSSVKKGLKMNSSVLK